MKKKKYEETMMRVKGLDDCDHERHAEKLLLLPGGVARIFNQIMADIKPLLDNFVLPAGVCDWHNMNGDIH